LLDLIEILLYHFQETTTIGKIGAIAGARDIDMEGFAKYTGK